MVCLNQDCGPPDSLEHNEVFNAIYYQAEGLSALAVIPAALLSFFVKSIKKKLLADGNAYRYTFSISLSFVIRL